MKKLMMAVAFLGVLTLGACVDDNESQSVTDVRNAKAEALRAQAALDKANAEAALITANAEAAVKAAEAAYRQAEAEAKQQEVELAKATLSIEIEAAIAQAEADLQAAKAALINAMASIDNAKNTQVSTLISQANAVLTKLSTARQAKLTATTNIAKLKAGLVSAEQAQAANIKTQQDIIAENEALIAEYTELKSNSYAEAEQAAVEANAAKDALQKVSNEKNGLYAAAQQDETAKMSSCQGSAFYQKVTGDYAGYYTSESIFDKEESPYNHSVEVTYADGSKETVTGSVRVFNYVIDEDAVETDKKSAEAAIASAKDDVAIKTAALADANKVKTDADKALADKKGTDAYKNALKAYNDAVAEVDKAKTEAEVNAAIAKRDAAKSDLDAVTASEENDVAAAEAGVETAEAALETAQQDLAGAQEDLADIDAAVAFATGDEAKAYAEMVEAYKKAWEAYYVTAYVAKEDAAKALNKQNDLCGVLTAVLNGTTDFETEIAACEAAISDAKATLVGLENTAPTQENLIKAEEEKLAQAEADIKAYEALYNNYMAQIQALIAAE